MKKDRKNHCKFGAGQEASKNPTKINFGRVLGCIWEGFGAVLGLLWVLSAASWPLFERSKSSFFQALAQNGLQEGFWMDFGSLWEGFGRVWGGFVEKFGRILDLLNTQWADFGNAWHDFALLGQIL